MYFPFIKYRKIFYWISGLLVLASLFSILNFGLNLGIDFTGGSALDISFVGKVPTSNQISESLKGLNLGKISVQELGKNTVSIRTKYIDEATHEEMVKKLSTTGKIEKGSESFQTIGPVIGNELKNKTKLVIVLALIFIVLYIAYSFKQVSRPVKSYLFGLTSLIALCHDVILPLGILAILGKTMGVEITIPIITAFLTIFGYSINDSVVVFDRVRENLLKLKTPDFSLVVEKSLNETITRSINTSFTTMLVLFAIFFFGGQTLKYFSLTLILGIFFGTYSSIFLATPLLVSYYYHKENKRAAGNKA